MSSNTVTNHYESAALDAYKSDVYFSKTEKYKHEVQQFVIDLLQLQRKSNHHSDNINDNDNDNNNKNNINNNDNDSDNDNTILIVDLGGGMGDLCLDLKRQLNERYSFLCVDPSKDLINEAKRNGIDSINADAIEFSLLDNKYDIIQCYAYFGGIRIHFRYRLESRVHFLHPEVMHF